MTAASELVSPLTTVKFFRRRDLNTLIQKFVMIVLQSFDAGSLRDQCLLSDAHGRTGLCIHAYCGPTLIRGSC
jgi:hypothetical protein